MKVKVNSITTGCISVSKAVIVPSFTMMASTVSDESLARDRDRQTDRHTDGRKQADRQTDTHTETDTQTRVIYVNICKVAIQHQIT